MSCLHQYGYSGNKINSAYMPASCQGAYYPGEEPGTYCDLTDSPCGDPDGDMPEECDFQSDTYEKCPKCEDGTIFRTGKGILYCPECGWRK